MIYGVRQQTNVVWAQDCETESHPANMEYPPDFFGDIKNIVVDIPLFSCHFPEIYVSPKNFHGVRHPKQALLELSPPVLIIAWKTSSFVLSCNLKYHFDVMSKA